MCMYFRIMEILEVFRRYASTEKDVRRQLLVHGTINPVLRQIPLNEVEAEMVPKLILNWIVQEGVKNIRYKVYFKIWENNVMKTKTVGEIRIKKRNDNTIIVCKVCQHVVPASNVMYHWPKGLTYEGLSQYELNKSMRQLRTRNQQKVGIK